MNLLTAFGSKLWTLLYKQLAKTKSRLTGFLKGILGLQTKRFTLKEEQIDRIFSKNFGFADKTGHAVGRAKTLTNCVPFLHSDIYADRTNGNNFGEQQKSVM